VATSSPAGALLDGKLAVVTGASSGLGQQIARTFAGHGARIVGLDLDPTLERVLGADDPGDRGHRVMACDVADPVRVAAVFAEIGPADVLVNSAGLREIGNVLDVSIDEWDRVVRVNLSGTFYCAQAAARAMVAGGRAGSIVNLASVTGLIGIANRPAYTSSKHGVVGLTKALAADLGAHGIRANCVCPGVVNTPMTAAYADDPVFARSLSANLPLGRLGVPEDVADVALFLASDLSRYVTGAAIPVDGGFMAEKGLGQQAGQRQDATGGADR
jgi:meso-butanediol dehydrogenase/(S,S)-butanediol dehydrogenase/diacetyl reductase